VSNAKIKPVFFSSFLVCVRLNKSSEEEEEASPPIQGFGDGGATP